MIRSSCPHSPAGPAYDRRRRERAGHKRAGHKRAAPAFATSAAETEAPQAPEAPIETFVETSADLIAAGDLLLFVNAAITSTGQREFHHAGEQSLSLDFLHRYLLGNYRDLYAATLALDINDHNAALIARNLLATPAGTSTERRCGTCCAGWGCRPLTSPRGSRDVRRCSGHGWRAAVSSSFSTMRLRPGRCGRSCPALPGAR